MRVMGWKNTRRWAAAGACAVGLAVGSCAAGSAETDDDSGPAAAPVAASLAAKAAKFRVVLNGGPFKGTYDVAADACMANIQRPGSWHATWEDETFPAEALSAVLVGYDPKPTFGKGLTMAVTFGRDDTQVMYEVLEPIHTVEDRGATATLTFTGKARVVRYSDGSFSDGGLVTITIDCGKVQRGPG